ncbi:unnamed protein product, partial [Eretmochelys imbricata]
MLLEKCLGFLYSGFCLWAYAFMSLIKGCSTCEPEERLFQKLFSHYNHFIRPVENVSDPVTVHFEVAITQLANV